MAMGPQPREEAQPQAGLYSYRQGKVGNNNSAMPELVPRGVRANRSEAGASAGDPVAASSWPLAEGGIAAATFSAPALR